jgi:hypothetical protein
MALKLNDSTEFDERNLQKSRGGVEGN